MPLCSYHYRRCTGDVTDPSQGSADLGTAGVMELPAILVDAVVQVGVPPTGLQLSSAGAPNEVRWLGTAV